jgi:hypothetical protein
VADRRSVLSQLLGLDPCVEGVGRAVAADDQCRAVVAEGAPGGTPHQLGLGQAHPSPVSSLGLRPVRVAPRSSTMARAPPTHGRG